MLDGTMRSIPIANKKQFDDISPADGDMIYVREHSYREATIFGAV